MNKTYHWLVGLHFTLCTLAMIWPGALIANRIEPMLLGLPFLFFWYILWMLVLFAGMWVAFVVRHGGRHHD
ncbi:hypothetical protein HPA02_19090 [Bisbaumannia pacifica]|uniref:DUF3311 domain-containing protein n=1 Tax=Bisbaumannia pacifica TaxID=77098 RepID=A0A510X857_9GAMM|nr:hypothetical protein [Halomonas pacifica]GEK47626.1 hypothetical protein HPA02_19090 [Halomonas pacifica]